MKKNAHEIELFIKEMVAGRERGKIMNEVLTARRAPNSAPNWTPNSPKSRT